MSTIRCPGCQARYKVPASAGGKRTKCKKCGQVFRIPELKPAAESPSAELTLDEAIQLEGSAPAVPVARVQGTVPAGPVAAPVVETVGYAPSDTAAEAAAARGAYGRYFRSLGRSLAFPAHTGNLITFVIMLVIVGMGGWLRGIAGFCLLGLAALILVGWYMSFQFAVVVGAAGGEEELPTLGLTNGIGEDIVFPLLRMLAATIMARLPALVFLLSVPAAPGAGGGLRVVLAVQFLFGWFDLLLDQPGGVTKLIGGVLLAAGFFLWPMFILIVSIGGTKGLVRFDLIGVTVARSFPAYMIVAGCVYLGIALKLVLQVTLAAGVIAASMVGSVWLVLLVPVVLVLVEVYVTIIQMRAIGLYYHHFKHKFAWSWG